MAIVPNLNGVQISAQTPLVDPRNLSARERSFTDDVYKSTTEITLIAGNQLVLGQSNIRNGIMFFLPADATEPVYISTSPLTSAAGIPIYPGNGFTFRGITAQSPFYCFGVSGLILTVMVG